MWSGPRNLSTVMMYAFGNRNDFAIWDEPFYAPYLVATGADHPMRDDIIKAHEVDAIKVAQRCIDSISAEKPHFYMKHMPHHMVDEFPLDWARGCVNIHLIRHPARVIASYGVKRANVTPADLGFQQQLDMYRRLGGIVINSADIRADPEGKLRQLCNAINLSFDPAMLSWDPGPRVEDGIWASHWYNNVHQSTGFAGPEGGMPVLFGRELVVFDAVMSQYQELAKVAI